MTEPFKKRDEEYFYIQEWSKINPKLVAGFTTKQGGFSKIFNGSLNCGFHVGDQIEDVHKNRQHLSYKLSMSIDSWVGAEQTHGVNIAKITSNERGRGAEDYSSSVPDTDGFYTDTPNTLLTLCFADCVPLYFYSSKNNMVGIAHAGWKGTVNGIASEMIGKWVSEGMNKKDILVAIGPSICGNCYIVDDRVIDSVKRWLKFTDDKPYQEITSGQYQLNLRKLNKIILENAGISFENIFITDLCTSCNIHDFYSHRRDQGITGRMLGFIGLKGD
jgi:polyphenol oxidase